MGGYWTHRCGSCAIPPHEVFRLADYPAGNLCAWCDDDGIALIHADDGPRRRTIQWAPDGFAFEITGETGCAPTAFDLYRGETHDGNPVGRARWGLCHCFDGGHRRARWNIIERFDFVGRE